MASSVTTRGRIALLYFGFALQSSCCTLDLLCRAAALCKRQKLWQGGRALLFCTLAVCTLLLVQVGRVASAVEHQVEPADKQQQKQQRRLALLTVHRLLLWLPEILETEDPM